MGVSGSWSTTVTSFRFPDMPYKYLESDYLIHIWIIHKYRFKTERFVSLIDRFKNNQYLI